jgi:hypothetical protein
MLLPVLKDIALRFNSSQIVASGGKRLMLGDIAKHEKERDTPGGGDTIQNNLVLTLVSVEEESSLKNNYPTRQEEAISLNQKPTLFLNLYLLFSANFDDYEEALKHLGYVLSFFQANTRISFSDASGDTYNLNFTLHNIGFESLHNLWTVLGGAAKPSVVYKARLIFIQGSPLNGAGLVTHIQSNEHLK